MSDEIILEFTDNPDFNDWLKENYLVEIEEYEFPSSEVLYRMSHEKYADALARYTADPKVRLSRQDLINNLFRHPYTKIEFLMRDLNISRLTAAKYLDTLAADGFLVKEKIWRSNYYINLPLFNLLKGENGPVDTEPVVLTRRMDQA